MSNSGWFKLHRDLLSKPIWLLSTPEQKVILITILAMANHEEKKWEWNGKPFTCQPGQFVTSLEHLANKCGQGVTVRNVRTALKRFENFEFLTNQVTKTGRLITVVNWGKYQGCSGQGDKPTDKQVTNDRQTSDKRLTTNKKGKNIRNKEYNSDSVSDQKNFSSKTNKKTKFSNFEERQYDMSKLEQMLIERQ